MRIHVVKCDQGCRPTPYASQARADAAAVAHYICAGHSACTTEVELAK